MKHKALKKATSCVLAAALTFSCASYFAVQQSTEAQAATNTWYEKKTSLQPYGTCLYMDQMRSWTPDADADARYNMGNVELKERFNGPLVNDNALTDPKLMLLAMVNPRCSTAQSQGGSEIGVYAPTNLQYADSLNYWGGSVAEGIIAIPTPEAIDMAHRNGVKSTGTIFFPWGGDGDPAWVSQMCEKAADGSFPIADKLLEIADYYGFDGYFVNGETSCPAVSGTIVEFCEYIQKKKPANFVMQWYDSLTPSGYVSWTDAVNDTNIGIIQHGDQRVTDEFFLNFNWGAKQTINSSIAKIESVGRSQWDIFATWENTPGGGTHYPTNRWNYMVDANGKAKTSIGVLAPQDTLYKSTSPEDFMNNTDVKMYSGPAMDPSNTSPTGNWPGMAHFIADHSTIKGDTFVSHFTSGNGYNFYKDGKIIRAGEWYNRSEMDVMPTWRWIVETNGSKLTPIIDFQDAYYGGTSINIKGTLEAANPNHIKLYSTQLDIKDTTKVRVAYKTDADKNNMKVGLCFGNSYDESNFVFYDVPEGTAANNGWKVAEIDVADQAGKQAIALSLKFASDADVANFNINVGELSVINTANETVLPAPSVTLDEALFEDYSNAEARIYWDEVDGAVDYEIYRVKADGSKEFMGSTPGTAYYLNRFFRDGNESSFNIEVVPVDETGTRGTAGILAFEWSIPAGTAETVDRNEPENLALKKDIWSNKSNDDIIKLNDGVITSSKWCVDGRASTSSPHIATIDMGEPTSISRWKVWHANCPGAGESPTMNTVDFKLRYSNDNQTWKDADVVVNNTLDITDRNLDEAITARYWQLYVTNGDRSPWTATRIYEWEMFADKYYEKSEAIPMANVYAFNNEGATDEVTIVKANPGDTVHLFKDLTTEDILATATVGSDGTAKFTGLDFGSASGRIYYSSKSSAPYDSVRRSVAYDAEAGDRTPVPADADISFVLSSKGSINLSNTEYGILTIKGLEAGTVARIYASADAQLPILASAPVAAGQDTLVQERIPMPKNTRAQSGTIYVEVQAPGLRSTERIALAYDKANIEALAEAVANALAVDTSNCTTSSVNALNEALAQAEAAKNDISVGSLAAADAVNAAVEGLTERVNTQVLEDLIAYADQIKAEGALDNCVEFVVNGFNTSLQAAKDLVASGDGTRQDVIDASVELLKFIHMVDFKQGDKTLLEIAVEIGNTINENLDLYVDTAAFTEALANGQATLDDGNAMQDEVDSAYNALVKAMKELRMKPNKDILNQMIADASAIDLSVYTADSANALTAALAAAQDVAAKEDATQDEVDSAVEALRAAKAGLVKNTNTGASEIPAPENKAPVNNAGEGSTPTKTGDAGSFAAFGVMTLAAAAVVLLRKKNG